MSNERSIENTNENRNENSYLTSDSIEELHVEITNLCNAACPMCARNHSGWGLRPNPGWGSWAEGEASKVFSKELTQLKRVFFCGTHGDPTAAPHLLDAVRISKERGARVAIYTNGSARSDQWWSELVSLMDSSDKVVFGIDGIETNHLYRQKTNINKVLHHLKICCASNVMTQWDFLAFRHNEHELDKCRRVADEMGVDIFTIRKTARFRNHFFEVKDKEGKVTHLLEPPLNPDLRHPDYEVMQQLNKQLPEHYHIECGYRQLKKIYVNSRLEVFPCCYISDENESMRLNMDSSRLLVPLEEMSLRKKSWSEILAHPFYREELLKSFTNEKVLKRCVKVCGVVKREQNQEQIVRGSQYI